MSNYHVKFSDGHAANLAAEAVSAIVGGPRLCDENSAMARINFEGVSYNHLPRALALDNIQSAADGNDTLLILNRIGGDLGTAQRRSPTSSASFTTTPKPA